MKEEQQALVRQEPMPLAIAPSPAQMMQSMIASGVTAANVAAFTELVKLSEHMEDRNAQKDFAAAFVALQRDMPVIVAHTVIPNRGKYERFEDLMNVLGPLLTKHGFAVTFSMDFKENRVLEICTLTHIGGHSRQNSFAVRAGGKADSETQADCKAATTAKRNALCNALNIVIRQDCLNEENDATILGECISKEQAEELARRVAETNSDRAAFLRFAGAESFATIASGKYNVLDSSLRKKERTQP